MKPIAILFLGGIEDGEYGEIDIETSQREIEALQERLVTSGDDVRVPLYALVEVTDKMVAAACAAVPALCRVDATRAIEAALETLSQGASNMREKLVGDGCEVCNSTKSLECAKRTITDLKERLCEIGDYAHENSTGPAVPDALWTVREMAYELV